MTENQRAPRICRLSVTVASAPEPALLRSAIEAALQGRPVGTGPESEVGAAVARAVDAHRLGERSEES